MEAGYCVHVLHPTMTGVKGGSGRTAWPLLQRWWCVCAEPEGWGACTFFVVWCPTARQDGFKNALSQAQADSDAHDMLGGGQVRSGQVRSGHCRAVRREVEVWLGGLRHQLHLHKQRQQQWQHCYD